MEIKHCSNCGAELKEGAVFCGNCGEKLVVETERPTVQKTTGKVDFDIIKKENLNMVKVSLVQGSFRYEAGGLHYMQGALELESKAPGMGKMMKSVLTRERIVKPIIKGTGTVFLQPSFGEFYILDLHNEEWILDRGAYFASDMAITIGSFTNAAVSAIFSGEKWFQTTVSGTGKVIITAAGPVQVLELKNDKLVVDGAFAVARTKGVDLKVTKATKGIFSTLISGEGILNTFSGTGKVLIAPVSNYINTLVYSINTISHQIQNSRKS